MSPEALRFLYTSRMELNLVVFFSPPPQDSGADCAKFQKSELEYKFNKRALERPYNSKNSWGKTYGEHKRHLEFSHEQYRELQRYAADVGISFTASGMDEVSVSSSQVVRLPRRLTECLLTDGGGVSP